MCFTLALKTFKHPELMLPLACFDGNLVTLSLGQVAYIRQKAPTAVHSLQWFQGVVWFMQLDTAPAYIDPYAALRSKTLAPADPEERELPSPCSLTFRCVLPSVTPGCA